MTLNDENEALPHEEIAWRAHEIYTERGGEPGQDVDDWLQAERELRTRRMGEMTEHAENSVPLVSNFV